MKRLILMRHAKSDWDDPTIADFNRPLNGRGRRAAAAVGNWLRQNAYLPDVVLCSSAARTAETYSRLGIDADVRYLRALYHAEPQEIADAIASEPDAGTVMVIGHNPGIALFAHGIFRTWPDHDRFADFPTAAALVAAIGGQPSGGTFEAFITPHDLPTE